MIAHSVFAVSLVFGVSARASPLALPTSSEAFGAFDEKAFAAVLEQESRLGGFSGTAYVVSPTKVLAEVRVGRADARGRSLQSDDTYRWASLSKFVAHLIAVRAHEEGKLELGRPYVSQVDLSGGVSPSLALSAGAFTLDDLLLHAPGWSISSPLWDELQAGRARSTSESFLRRVRVERAHGTHTYCNACYDLVGIALEAQLGRPFTALVSDAFGLESVRDATTKPLWRVGGLWQENFFDLASHGPLGSFRAAGNVVASGPAGARFLQGALRDMAGAGNGDLARVTERVLRAGPTGAGLLVRDEPGIGRVYWHTGADPIGFASALMLSQSGDWGALLLSNAWMQGDPFELLRQAVVAGREPSRSEVRSSWSDLSEALFLWTGPTWKRVLVFSPVVFVFVVFGVIWHSYRNRLQTRRFRWTTAASPRVGVLCFALPDIVAWPTFLTATLVTGGLLVCALGADVVSRRKGTDLPSTMPSESS